MRSNQHPALHPNQVPPSEGTRDNSEAAEIGGVLHSTATRISLAMTTTATDALEIPRDPSEIFGELLERNHRVCKRCYTRIKRRAARPWTHGKKWEDVGAHLEHQDDDGRLGRYFETEPLGDRTTDAHPPGEGSGTSTACSCGAVEPHRSPPTRSRSDAVDAAFGISRTLHEFGVNHGTPLLVGEVSRLKTEPETAGNDFETFRRATARAVRVTRTAQR